MLLDVIHAEVQSFGRDEGLVASKLEGTYLLSLVRTPPGWSQRDAAEALRLLIVNLVSTMSERERSAARVAMMLDERYQERSARARWRTFARDREIHPDTVRTGWWQRAVGTLSQQLPARIEEINSEPPGWEAYRVGSTTLADQDDQRRPNHYLETVDVAWLMRGRVVSELLTYRTIVAREDGVDKYQSRAWYFSDPDPDKYEVVALMNCVKGDSYRPGNRGILLTDLIFPEPLAKGERLFFAYKVLIHSDRDSESVFRHEVRSDGVGLLVFRVQFDPQILPSRTWSFVCQDDAEPYIAPPEGSPRYLVPNRSGYVEHRFQGCKHGLMYGISYKWPES